MFPARRALHSRRRTDANKIDSWSRSLGIRGFPFLSLSDHCYFVFNTLRA